MLQDTQQGIGTNQRAPIQGPVREVGMGPIIEVKEAGMGSVRGQRGGHRLRQRGGHQKKGGRWQGTVVSKEVLPIVVDHVVKRGLTMAEAA
jgi:hypothetical protein